MISAPYAIQYDCVDRSMYQCHLTPVLFVFVNIVLNRSFSYAINPNLTLSFASATAKIRFSAQWYFIHVFRKFCASVSLLESSRFFLHSCLLSTTLYSVALVTVICQLCLIPTTVYSTAVDETQRARQRASVFCIDIVMTIVSYSRLVSSLMSLVCTLYCTVSA